MAADTSYPRADRPVRRACSNARSSSITNTRATDQSACALLEEEGVLVQIALNSRLRPNYRSDGRLAWAVRPSSLDRSKVTCPRGDRTTMTGHTARRITPRDTLPRRDA